MSDLVIADDLALPVDYMTKTCAILAQRRKGKTYTANVLAEELVAAEQPWVALDPTGAWWGLRASADGEGVGLPVVILGGTHGDAPLERSSGSYVADLVLDHPGWYVLDMSLFESKAAEREFSAAFADRLYRRKGEARMDFPLHLFVDEADMFVPQDREAADTKVLGAFQSIVRRGGLRGLGTTLISQRPALVNKSVLVQLDMLILLRLVAGNDQDYVDKNYVSRSGSKEQRTELMGSLASLRLGEAWVWEPGAEPALFERVQVRERRTFNSSATPKVGETPVVPKKMATVDLDAVKAAMAAAIDRDDAEDTGTLREQLRVARSQIMSLREEVNRAAAVPTYAFPAEWLAVLHDVADAGRAFQATIDEKIAALPVAPVVPLAEVDTSAAEYAAPARNTAQAEQPRKPVTRASVPPAPRNMRGIPRDRAESDLGEPEVKVLTALSWYAEEGRSTKEIAFLAGYSARASTIGAILTGLRQKGLVAYGQPAKITEAGLAAIGGAQQRPTGKKLIEHWMSHPKVGEPERRVLNVLIEMWPTVPTMAQLYDATGYSPSASTLGAILSNLRRLGLVVKPGPTLAPALAQAIRK